MKKKWIAMSLFVSLFSLMTIKVIKDQLYVNKIEKKFLLNGTFYQSDDTFNYYELHDKGYEGNLAVSLKDGATTSYPINIPSDYDGKDVIGIYSYGFANRNNISVTIPNTIKVIDYEAFFNTNFSDTKITIPYSVKKMGTAAFFHTNIQSLVFSDGTEENVGVCPDPQTVEKKAEKPGSQSTKQGPQLTEIPDFCFAKCRDLSLISFPNSLTSIKEEAFEYCSSLKTVAFLSGLESLGNRAFNCCSSLKEVYLPSTILSTSNTSSIGEYCFAYCDDNLNFKLSMKETDYQAFTTNNSNWDRKGELNSNIYNHSFITGDVYAKRSWLYNLQTVGNGQTVNLIRFIGKMESNGNMAFPDKINEKVVTSFSGGCIPSEYQNKIKNIFFPKNLKSIPESFFNDQQYSNLTYIGSMSGNDCYDISTVRNNTVDLSNLENLTSIGENAFCFSQDTRSRFKTLKLPANLEIIGNDAFNNFNYVTEFSIRSETERATTNSLTIGRTTTNPLKIGDRAFHSLGYYSEVGNTGTYIKAGNRGTVDLILPKETTSIGKKAFLFANCLNSLTILGGETNLTLTLSEDCFFDCDNLQKVVIQDRKMNDSYKSVILGNRCFARWKSDSDSRDYRDYSYKPGLQVVYLPNGVELKKDTKTQFDRQIRVSIYFGGSKIELPDSKLFDEVLDGSGYTDNNTGTDSLVHKTNKTQFKFNCPIPVYENVAFGTDDPDYSTKNYVLDDQGLNEGTEVNNKCAYLLNKKDQTAILTKYRFDMWDEGNPTDAIVDIPDEINFNNENYKVTEIGDCAFASSDSYDFYNGKNNSETTYRTIKTLILPNSITKIGQYAFFRCAGLEKVQVSEENTSVPSKLNEIGYLAFAFSGLTQLLNLNANCTIITDVDNPSTNNVSKPSPFLNCPNLEKVTTISPGSATGSRLTENEKALFDSNGNVLTVFPNYKGNDKTFSNSAKFHFGAFKAVGWITNMTVSSSNFTSDPQALFVGFSSIEEIRTKCVFKGRVDENASQLTNNVRFETLELKGPLSSSSTIPDGAFMKSNIKKIILPYGGDSNHNPCGVIPSNFLNSITTDNNGIVFQVYNQNGQLNNSDGKTGYLDLQDCGYTTISSNAFSNAKCLTSINLQGVTTIENNAFLNSGLEGKLVLPDTVTSIGNSSFMGCTGLTSVQLSTHNNFKSIPDNAFKGCIGLTEINIPGYITSIGQSAFENASNCKSLNFEGGGELKLGDNAFSGCTSLGNELNLSARTFDVGNYAFSGCNKLERLNVGEHIKRIGKSAFDSTALKEVDLSSCTELEELNGFSNCKKLTKVIFPKSIISIGDSCFSGCTSLKSVYPSGQSMKEGYVYLPSKVNSIGSNAFGPNIKEFNGCTSITHIYCLADSLTIGDSAFSGCTSLQYFVMDTTGTFKYGSSIFSGCTSLSRVVLPKGFNMESDTPLFTGLTQFAKDSYVCLNNDYTVFGDIIHNWMKINDTQNVKYAFKEGTYKGTTKPVNYKEWKWNGDKTNIEIIPYSNSTSNSILFFEAEKRFSL